MPDISESDDLSRRAPMEDQIACAVEAATALSRTRAAGGVLAIHRGDGTSVRLAPAIADVVIDLLNGIASGKAVTQVPAGAMLTTGQAANILNVSRPHFEPTHSGSPR